MGRHDLSYRLFFTHRRMIQDLLREIVGERWVERIDLDSGELVNASFVSDRHEKRDSDVIWKFRRKDRNEPLYVYILVEFQSRPDPAMPVRLMGYENFIYHGLLSNQLFRIEKSSDDEFLGSAESIERWNRGALEHLRQKVRQEEWSKARQDGEARVLLRLLRLKFGPLDPETEERVRSTDADRLLQWTDRILTAKQLADVFQE